MSNDFSVNLTLVDIKTNIFLTEYCFAKKIPKHDCSCSKYAWVLI